MFVKSNFQEGSFWKSSGNFSPTKKIVIDRNNYKNYKSAEEVDNLLLSSTNFKKENSSFDNYLSDPDTKDKLFGLVPICQLNKGINNKGSLLVFNSSTVIKDESGILGKNDFSEICLDNIKITDSGDKILIEDKTQPNIKIELNKDITCYGNYTSSGNYTTLSDALALNSNISNTNNSFTKSELTKNISSYNSYFNSDINGTLFDTFLNNDDKKAK